MSLKSVLYITAGALVFSGVSLAEAEKKKSPLGLLGSFSTSSTLHEIEDESRSVSSSLNLSPILKLSDAWQLRATFGISQALTGTTKTSIKDSKLLTKFKTQLNPYLTFNPAAGVVLPTNDVSRERSSLQAALYVAPRIRFDLSRLGVDLSGLYDLSFRKNFHGFNTSTTGAPNEEYSLDHWIQLSYDLGKGFSFAFDTNFSTGWTYSGSYQTSFNLGQELNFDVAKGLTLGLGHTNSGDVVKANQEDSNISLFDSNSSRIYGVLYWSL